MRAETAALFREDPYDIATDNLAEARQLLTERRVIAATPLIGTWTTRAPWITTGRRAVLPTAVQVRQDRPHLVDLLLLPCHDGLAESEDSLILKGRLIAHQDRPGVMRDHRP